MNATPGARKDVNTAAFTQSGDASAQSREAMDRETVQGDLSGAITEYRRLADGSADRAVQAQALRPPRLPRT